MLRGERIIPDLARSRACAWTFGTRNVNLTHFVNARESERSYARQARSMQRPRERSRASAQAEQHRARERALRGGIASSNVSATPRGQRRAARSLPKRCIEAVRERDAGLPVARAARGVAREHRRRRRARSRGASRIACASSHASRRPRLKPWPAIGCSVCAALPMTHRSGDTIGRARLERQRKRAALDATRAKPATRVPK